MLLHMHSQERMRTWKHCFVLISIIQLDWINEERDEWKNEEEVWALIHLIHLARKMICYDTKIAYTYVRIPNSNKIFLWNCTPLP